MEKAETLKEDRVDRELRIANAKLYKKRIELKRKELLKWLTTPKLLGYPPGIE